MQKYFSISLLLLLAGCASLPFFGRPKQLPPAVPIFFAPESSTLDQPSLTAIQGVAQAAAAQPDSQLYVTGATDSTGTAAANRILSDARAKSVAAQLATDGVDPARIHIRAIGEAAAPGPDGTSAQVARRALIELKPQ